MSIVFEVIDTQCEQASQSFFIPQVRIQTKSTTQYAQLFGYSEFIPSSPPKKYRKATVSGVSERIGFTCEQTPRMCAGAMYTWSGSGEYDVKGVQISSYSKKFYAQCPKQYWPIVPLQLNPSAISPSGKLPPTTFVGYCWPDDLNSCQVCPPDLVDWPFIQEQTTNVLLLDLQGFQVPVGGISKTPTVYSASGQVAGFTGISSPPHTATGNGQFYNVQVGSEIFQAEGAVTNPPLAFPVVFMSSHSAAATGAFEAAYINWIDANAFSCVLSEEYTDADALANAQTVSGTGATAATTPRTTGFVSVFTSVVFTLFLSNLIVGKDYVVTVDLWEKGPNNLNMHTPKQYGFTADDVDHTITDVVPTPANNHTITVQKPTITFAPL